MAALTVIGAGLVRFPMAVADPAVSAPEPKQATAKEVVERPVKYVRLEPGQKAPKGAKVIRKAAPTPRIVVRRVAPVTQVAPRPAPRRVVTRTRQSG